MYFPLRGRAAKQSIIFRIPTPGAGCHFCIVGSMVGSIFFIIDSERLGKPFALRKCALNRLDRNISYKILGQYTPLFKETRGKGIV